ncbi:MAG: GTP cyclohydrolase I, partial [Rhodoferax sp.]|nr:GTP cyclohydrolase I [Pseudorhodobacter sp.]
MQSDALAIFKPLHTTVSKRIRERLVARQARFFANDNIAACIMPGEIDELVDEVGAKLQDVLDSLVINT